MAEQKRDWKPGDVLMVRGEVALVTTCTPKIDDLYVETARGRSLHMDEVDAARPLVVIDPEDREQVSVLARSLGRLLGDIVTTGEMQAALREFANPTPPKPEEPTGLGAVVEDAKGVKWVGLGTEFANGQMRWQNERCAFASYRSIDAVKVLSEGVVPS